MEKPSGPKYLILQTSALKQAVYVFFILIALFVSKAQAVAENCGSVFLSSSDALTKEALRDLNKTILKPYLRNQTNRRDVNALEKRLSTWLASMINAEVLEYPLKVRRAMLTQPNVVGSVERAPHIYPNDLPNISESVRGLIHQKIYLIDKQIEQAIHQNQEIPALLLLERDVLWDMSHSVTLIEPAIRLSVNQFNLKSKLHETGDRIQDISNAIFGGDANRFSNAIKNALIMGSSGLALKYLGEPQLTNVAFHGALFLNGVVLGTVPKFIIDATSSVYVSTRRILINAIQGSTIRKEVRERIHQSLTTTHANSLWNGLEKPLLIELFTSRQAEFRNAIEQRQPLESQLKNWIDLTLMQREISNHLAVISIRPTLTLENAVALSKLVESRLQAKQKISLSNDEMNLVQSELSEIQKFQEDLTKAKAALAQSVDLYEVLQQKQDQTIIPRDDIEIARVTALVGISTIDLLSQALSARTTLLNTLSQ